MKVTLDPRLKKIYFMQLLLFLFFYTCSNPFFFLFMNGIFSNPCLAENHLYPLYFLVSPIKITLLVVVVEGGRFEYLVPCFLCNMNVYIYLISVVKFILCCKIQDFEIVSGFLILCLFKIP